MHFRRICSDAVLYEVNFSFNHAVIIDNSDNSNNKGQGILSSGTIEGIGIAEVVTALKLKAVDFVYCDEKFSHVHSAAEKAFLSLLIGMLGPNQQLFFTTHNSDILDMNLPLHSFAFLRRDEFDDNAVSCVFASDYIKKNTQSLKNAVENDLFSAAPDTDRIYRILD